jgi:anti-anti-sigma factor
VEIRVTKKKHAVIVAVQGRMDATTAPAFETHMTAVIAEGTTYCIVDCQALEYISSAGLRSALRVGKTLQTQGGKLVFAALQGSVHEVFEIAGFNTMFQVFASEDAALEQA